MSFRTDTRDTVRRQRAARPHRTGGTVTARPETLREVVARSGGAGVGIVVESGQSYYPFDSAAEYEQYKKEYDGKALGRIARALREPDVQARLTHDTGTAPELHVVGRFLQLDWTIGIPGAGLYFQDKAEFGTKSFRRNNRVFISDVGLIWFGLPVLMPVDGEEWHNKTQVEREDDARRNVALQGAKLGTQPRKVLPIPSRYCFEGDTLDAFLQQGLGAR